MPKQQQKTLEQIDIELALARQAKLELEIKELKQRNRIYDCIRQYKGLYRVGIGGSASGKSYEWADIVIDRIVHETSDKTGQRHRILCLRKNYTDIRKSTFPLLKDECRRLYPDLDWKINSGQGNELIVLGDNEILFAGLDDAEKLHSIYNVTSIWVEEADQITFEDFRELERRMRGYTGYMQMMLSFNPVNINSWIKTRFFDNIDEHTICIRGKEPFEDFEKYTKITPEKYDINKQETKTDPDTKEEYETYFYHTIITHSTFKDNRFLKPEDRQKLRDLKKYDVNEYNVYALGRWGVMGGTYFDAEKINDRKKAMEELIAKHGLLRGEFTYTYLSYKVLDSTIRFSEDRYGPVRIYAPPRKNTPYVIGADTAGDGSDFNAAACINNITKTDAASIHTDMDEDVFARLLYCMGKYYGDLSECTNNALIAVETNFSTYPNKKIIEMGYNNIYVREGQKDEYTFKDTKKYGFLTTTKTRPYMLDALKTVVRDEPEKICDLVFLEEAQTFVKNAKTGKPEAMLNQHDDMIMARAIAGYASESGQQYESELEAYIDYDISTLRASYREDYLAADEETQLRMMQFFISRGMIKTTKEDEEDYG